MFLNWRVISLPTRWWTCECYYINTTIITYEMYMLELNRVLFLDCLLNEYISFPEIVWPQDGRLPRDSWGGVEQEGGV